MLFLSINIHQGPTNHSLIIEETLKNKAFPPLAPVSVPPPSYTMKLDSSENTPRIFFSWPKLAGSMKSCLLWLMFRI